MRNRLGAGDFRSWDDAVLGVNSPSWPGEIEREDITPYSLVMVELSTRKREIRRDGGNHHGTPGLGEYCVRLNWPSPTQQVRVPIRRVLTPIRGLLNPIRQVVLLISHSRSYPPYCSHLDPPSRPFSSTTLPSSQEHNVKSSLSISPCYHRELILSTAYTEYSIHRVQHTPSTAYT